MNGWDYHYRSHGIYGWLSIPAFLGMAVGAYQLGGWLGLAVFVALVGALMSRAKGFNVLDCFSSAVQPLFVLFTIAAFAWSFIRNW